MSEIVWTIGAVKDLEYIEAYIAGGSPEYAPVFVHKIAETVEMLDDFPQIGRIVPEFDDASLREIIFQNYRIIYKINNERIGIIAVWHSYMDLTAGKESRTWDFT